MERGDDIRPTPATSQLTLRELAHGIYPPMLADPGLSAALQAQVHKRLFLAPMVVAAGGIAVWYRQAYKVWPARGLRSRALVRADYESFGGPRRTWPQITSQERQKLPPPLVRRHERPSAGQDTGIDRARSAMADGLRLRPGWLPVARGV